MIYVENLFSLAIGGILELTENLDTAMRNASESINKNKYNLKMELNLNDPH